MSVPSSPVKIQARLIFLALVPLLLTSMALTLFFLSGRLSRMEDSLLLNGHSLARQLSAASEFALFSGNRAVLVNLASALLQEPSVAAVIIRDTSGGIVVQQGLGRAALPEAVVDSFDSANYLVLTERVNFAITPLDDLYASNIDAAPQFEALGSVQIVMSRKLLQEAQQSALRTSLLIAAVVILLALLLAHRFAVKLARPLATLSMAVARMREGVYQERVGEDFDTKELRELATGFNQMAMEIEGAHLNLQEKVDLATRELNAKRLDAERANQAKSHFLAAASHDLRQPLHAVSLFADQLLHRNLHPDEARLVGRIVESTEALAGLMDALLDISRLDSGAMQVRISHFSLGSVFQNLQNNFTELAAKKGLRLIVRPNAYWVSSDRALLERSLINLLTNALRYTRKGSVLLAARRRGEGIRIEVRDSGIGIRLEDQALIFSEFVQLNNPARDREKGLGLGLSIVQRMCALLEHPIGLRSKVGQGSVFWLQVPTAPAQEKPPVPAPQSGQSLQERVFLLVDDASRQGSVQEQLLAWESKVLLANSVIDAKRVLNAQRSLPDVIICNHQLLSGDSGIQVIQQLREDFGSPIPAVLVAEAYDSAFMKEAQSHGLPVLRNPVRSAKLRAVLQGIFADGSSE